jgi:hypothetical protein
MTRCGKVGGIFDPHGCPKANANRDHPVNNHKPEKHLNLVDRNGRIIGLGIKYDKNAKT